MNVLINACLTTLNQMLGLVCTVLQALQKNHKAKWKTRPKYLSFRAQCKWLVTFCLLTLLAHQTSILLLECSLVLSLANCLCDSAFCKLQGNYNPFSVLCHLSAGFPAGLY